MRIAVDVRALQLGSEYRGIGAYLLNVLRRLPIGDGEHRFVFLRYDGGDPLAGLDLPPRSHDEIVVRRRPVTGRVASWRQRWEEAFSSDFGSLQQEQVDVFWQPDFHQGVPELPGTRVVVTMYDLIPLVMPAEYLPSRRQRLRRDGRDLRTTLRYVVSGEVWSQRYRRRVAELRHADTIISISEATTNDLVRLLGFDAARVVTIPLGAPDGGAADGGEPDVDLVASLDDRAFLLFIGGVDPRRRLTDLVGAYDELRRRGRALDLVLVGRDLEILHDLHHRDAQRALADSPYRDGLHVLGYVSDASRDWLYRHAAAFVFPSVYEGFGLPVLEAMVHRCPVVTYRNSSLVEVAGDAAVLVDPPGAGPLADAIGALLDDPRRRDALVNLGIEQAARFSWDRCAADTLATLLRG